MALSDEQIKRRRNFIGGSDANTLCSGNFERINNLALFKRGLRDPDDLSNILQVQLGSYTEPFNRYWFTKQTGWVITNDGDERLHPDIYYMAATLDGLINLNPDLFVYEAKHTNAFATPEDTQIYYYPQVQHNIHVTGAKGAMLSVIYGNSKWEYYKIPRDDEYISNLLEIEKNFWECVELGVEPHPAEPPKPKIEAIRKVDMTGHNEWADHAASWLENKEAAKKFTDATASLKGLIEEDTAEAFGHGITAKRSKAGSITIREAK